ncbi:MAG: flagellar motor switch protein FliM [Armatimonadetes bacterium]|nr:flagellar motor switch protein FliM [Armatimonadota bacterium]
MSDVLSQAEIEALLHDEGAGPGGPSTDAGAPLGARSAVPVRRSINSENSIAYELYDFRRPDKLSKDQLRTLQILHETFGRMAGSSLSAYLRSPVTIDLICFEQVPYEEYLRSINESVFTILTLQPLSGQAVLELEFELAFSVIDRMLGGPGRALKRTSLTDIERPLVRQCIERLFSALKSAWEGVVIVNPIIEGLETSAQFVQIAPPDDIVVTILFEVKVGEQRGAMSLCIPYLVLKPIASKLSAQKWFASGTRKQNVQTKRQIATQIQQSQVECAVKLGSTRISVEDFMGLVPGNIVKLDQPTSQDLLFTVADLPKLHGKPALNGSKLVFTVTSTAE